MSRHLDESLQGTEPGGCARSLTHNSGVRIWLEKYASNVSSGFYIASSSILTFSKAVRELGSEDWLSPKLLDALLLPQSYDSWEAQGGAIILANNFFGMACSQTDRGFAAWCAIFQVGLTMMSWEDLCHHQPLAMMGYVLHMTGANLGLSSAMPRHYFVRAGEALDSGAGKTINAFKRAGQLLTCGLTGHPYETARDFTANISLPASIGRRFKRAREILKPAAHEAARAFKRADQLLTRRFADRPREMMSILGFAGNFPYLAQAVWHGLLAKSAAFCGWVVGDGLLYYSRPEDQRTKPVLPPPAP